MTLAEFKRGFKVGMRLRKVRGFPKKGRIDQMRLVTKVNSVGFVMEGEAVPPGMGGSYLDWPKAAKLKLTEKGFICADEMGHEVEFEWVDDHMISQSPKDAAVDFLLNAWEHCEDSTDAALALGDAICNQEVASRIIDAWDRLEAPYRISLGRPEMCDRSLRAWLDVFWDWSVVPQTIDE